MLLLLACGLVGPETGDGDSSETAEPLDTGALGHDAVVAPLWQASCVDAGCHDGTGSVPLDLLNLDPYEQLVSRAALEAPLMDLVEPGHPERSYLVHKLRGTQLEAGGMGQPMPLESPLASDELALIEGWIRQGAAR